jgi:tRNA(Arg) A34 adenosine deaminase TadA
MDEHDAKMMRLSFEVAREARQKSNHPFGALLVDGQGRVLLKGENTVVTESDCTGHAETNLLREASRLFAPDFLATCTLYASTEPCPMCAAAIFWSNVRRVVFGLSTARLNERVGGESEDVMWLPCREVLSRGRKTIEVIGPLLEDEASEVVEGFW